METKYKLIYADRKTISLRIDEKGQLIVRAPRFTPRAEIEKTIEMYSARLEKMREYAKVKEKAFTQVDKTELEKRLKEIVLPFIEKYSKAMGVAPKSVNFTNAKKRLGSCNSKKQSASLVTLLCILMQQLNM